MRGGQRRPAPPPMRPLTRRHLGGFRKTAGRFRLSAAMETCSNCGRSIGESEEVFLFEQKVVCAACHADLREHVVPFAPYAVPKVEPAGPPLRGPVRDPEERKRPFYADDEVQVSNF